MGKTELERAVDQIRERFPKLKDYEAEEALKANDHSVAKTLDSLLQNGAGSVKWQSVKPKPKPKPKDKEEEEEARGNRGGSGAQRRGDERPRERRPRPPPAPEKATEPEPAAPAQPTVIQKGAIGNAVTKGVSYADRLRGVPQPTVTALPLPPLPPAAAPASKATAAPASKPAATPADAGATNQQQQQPAKTNGFAPHTAALAAGGGNATKASATPPTAQYDVGAVPPKKERHEERGGTAAAPAAAPAPAPSHSKEPTPAAVVPASTMTLPAPRTVTAAAAAAAAAASAPPPATTANVVPAASAEVVDGSASRPPRRERRDRRDRRPNRSGADADAAVAGGEEVSAAPLVEPAVSKASAAAAVAPQRLAPHHIDPAILQQGPAANHPLSKPATVAASAPPAKPLAPAAPVAVAPSPQQQQHKAAAAAPSAPLPAGAAFATAEAAAPRRDRKVRKPIANPFETLPVVTLPARVSEIAAAHPHSYAFHGEGSSYVRNAPAPVPLAPLTASAAGAAPAVPAASLARPAGPAAPIGTVLGPSAAVAPSSSGVGPAVAPTAVADHAYGEAARFTAQQPGGPSRLPAARPAYAAGPVGGPQAQQREFSQYHMSAGNAGSLGEYGYGQSTQQRLNSAAGWANSGGGWNAFEGYTRDNSWARVPQPSNNNRPQWPGTSYYGGGTHPYTAHGNAGAGDRVW